MLTRCAPAMRRGMAMSFRRTFSNQAVKESAGDVAKKPMSIWGAQLFLSPHLPPCVSCLRLILHHSESWVRDGRRGTQNSLFPIDLSMCIHTHLHYRWPWYLWLSLVGLTKMVNQHWLHSSRGPDSHHRSIIGRVRYSTPFSDGCPISHILSYPFHAMQLIFPHGGNEVGS